jgi:hypothetical protein
MESVSMSLRLVIDNDGFDCAPFFTVLRSLIDLIETVKLGQFLEREAPKHRH